jgi:hypothetical protein
MTKAVVAQMIGTQYRATNEMSIFSNSDQSVHIINPPFVERIA